MEKLKPYLGPFLLQVSLAGMNILVRLSLKDGLNHFVLVTYRLAIATVAIVPFAYVFEYCRKERPTLTWTILFQIFCLACGLTVSQNCYFQGLYYTSSTFGSAALNLVPVFTFVLALFIRLEKLDIRTLRGQAKVVGTVICVGGAMVMTFYKGPAIKNPSADQNEKNVNGSDSDTNNMALGSILVFGGTLAWSAWITFQGPVLKKYPAQLSFTALMCLFGSLQCGLIAIIFEHRKWDVWTVPSNIQLVTIFYTGIICGALAFFVQAWCIQKKGPVFAGVFSPLCTLVTALLEFSILRVSLHTGSVVGAMVIVTGLYFALWGKAKEHAKTAKVSTAEGNAVEYKDVENQYGENQGNAHESQIPYEDGKGTSVTSTIRIIPIHTLQI